MAKDENSEQTWDFYWSDYSEAGQAKFKEMSAKLNYEIPEEVISDKVPLDTYRAKSKKERKEGVMEPEECNCRVCQARREKGRIGEELIDDFLDSPRGEALINSAPKDLQDLPYKVKKEIVKRLIMTDGSADVAGVAVNPVTGESVILSTKEADHLQGIIAAQEAEELDDKDFN